jgi:hypothetical protein
MSSAEDNDHPAAIDDQSHLLQRTGSRFLVHSSAPSATTEGGNVIHLVDETAEELSAEVVPTILSFLTPKQIMRARGVCTTWRDAAKKTLVPLTEFKVDSVRSYNAMRAMSTALPTLQQLSICDLDCGHKYSDGDDPDEENAAKTADDTAHDIDIISNFTNLRILEIYEAPLNGRYPVLFNFPLLQQLRISCDNLKWDLEILRVLKDTLEKVTIMNYPQIEGNFMDLADFPRLKALDLRQTNVTGDIRDIRGNDFPALERLFLPKSVHGGIDYEIQHASDVPSLMHAIHLLLQRNPDLFEENGVSEAFYSQLIVYSVRSYNAMRVMSTALPTLQQLTIYGLGRGHIFSDGEDPKYLLFSADDTAHDIDIISNFTNLRSLAIYDAPLNGRYPVLFNFPLLQQLRISCDNLKWDLEMLAGLPSLKEFHCHKASNYDNVSCVNVTGNISSLRVLKDTLEKVSIAKCPNIEGNLMDLADFPRLKELDLQYIGMLSGNINCLRGLQDNLEKFIFGSYRGTDEIRGNFMDLADFPRLKVLDLRGTAVTGDIRDICGHDFPALERLLLPESVHGGQLYEFQSIADVPSFMHAIHLLLQRNLGMFFSGYHSMLEWTQAYFWSLSQNSPDWYEHVIDESESDDSESDDSESDESELPPPPFELLVVEVGSRLGWCWAFCESPSVNRFSQFCEINWLDPEPISGSVGYENYIEELRRIEQRQHRIKIDFYRGYHQPPTRKEYRRLCDRYWEGRKDQILNESDVEDQILNESGGEVPTLEERVLGNERTTVTQEGDEVGKEEKGEFEEDSKEGQANQAER